MVQTEPVIAYYEEEDQDLDKVLDIFIRTNSGGTTLSYSDMLMSMATAQWENLDAREAIHGTVDEINRTGDGFGFSKDFLLKAAGDLGERCGFAADRATERHQRARRRGVSVGEAGSGDASAR